MGIITNNTELKVIAKDINLRCDPLHTINYTNFEELYNQLDINSISLTDIVNSISNGVNFQANNYSIEPSSHLYISVKEFGNGIQLIKNENDELNEHITFLKDIVTETSSYNDGLIKTNEVILARSGAIGKVVWLGDFLSENEDLNLIASGFTTKLNIKDGNNFKFITLWINLPMIKYFLAAKSAGKCQRNISQDYIYQVPFPSISIEEQDRIAELFYSRLIEIEESKKNIITTSGIVNNVLEAIFNIDLNFSIETGIRRSTCDLKTISDRNSFRCDAKLDINYFKKVNEIFEILPYRKLGDFFSNPFLKGKQPIYLADQESDGIHVISTLAIQDHSIIKENCKKVSSEIYDNSEDALNPQIGDILLTLDGATSVGKPVYFDKEEEFGIDSHIGIIRLDSPEHAKLISLLLGSKLCNAQFRMLESGATSMSISESDIRDLKIPFLDADQIELFFSLFKNEIQTRNDILSLYEENKNELNMAYLSEIEGSKL